MNLLKDTNALRTHGDAQIKIQSGEESWNTFRSALPFLSSGVKVNSYWSCPPQQAKAFFGSTKFFRVLLLTKLIFLTAFSGSHDLIILKAAGIHKFKSESEEEIYK